MTSSLTPGYRRLAALIALIGWMALAGQLVLSLVYFAQDGGTPAEALWRYCGYFTITTNLLVAFVMTAAARGTVLLPRLGEASLLAGATLAILFVGVVYHLLLAAPAVDWLHWVVDRSLHYLVPALALLLWLAGAPKAALGFRDPLRWALYPIFYLIYSWSRGALDGWYPYSFLDVGRLGYGQALIAALGLAGGFIAAGLALVLLARLLTRLRPDAAIP